MQELQVFGFCMPPFWQETVVLPQLLAKHLLAKCEGPTPATVETVHGEDVADRGLVEAHGVLVVDVLGDDHGGACVDSESELGLCVVIGNKTFQENGKKIKTYSVFFFYNKRS